MFKTCPVCEVEKPLGEYRKDKTSPSGYQYRCKQCARASITGLYNTKYKEKYGKKGRARSALTTAKLKAIKLYLGCYCCSEVYPNCLEFHHVDESQKDFIISGAKQRSWESIQNELKKCICVCANCHRKIHDEVIIEDFVTITDEMLTKILEPAI